MTLNMCTYKYMSSIKKDFKEFLCLHAPYHPPRWLTTPASVAPPPAEHHPTRGPPRGEVILFPPVLFLLSVVFCAYRLYYSCYPLTCRISQLGGNSQHCLSLQIVYVISRYHVSTLLKSHSTSRSFVNRAFYGDNSTAITLEKLLNPIKFVKPVYIGFTA